MSSTCFEEIADADNAVLSCMLPYCLQDVVIAKGGACSDCLCFLAASAAAASASPAAITATTLPTRVFK